MPDPMSPAPAASPFSMPPGRDLHHLSEALTRRAEREDARREKDRGIPAVPVMGAKPPTLRELADREDRARRLSAISGPLPLEEIPAAVGVLRELVREAEDEPGDLRFSATVPISSMPGFSPDAAPCCRVIESDGKTGRIQAGPPSEDRQPVVLPQQPAVLPCLLGPGAVLPSRGRPQDAGLDLTATTTTIIPAGSVATIDTGVHAAIPPGHCGLIVGRSGLGASGIWCFLGLIDSEYRGSIGVVLANHSRDGVAFYPGDRVAQLLVLSHAALAPMAVDVLDGTGRGTAGWGSSGR